MNVRSILNNDKSTKEIVDFTVNKLRHFANCLENGDGDDLTLGEWVALTKIAAIIADIEEK